MHEIEEKHTEKLPEKMLIFDREQQQHNNKKKRIYI